MMATRAWLTSDRSTGLENLDDLLERPCPPRYPHPGRVYTNRLKPDTPHDFAGALVRTLPTLLSMRPDLRRLAAECRRLGYLGCFVYTLSPTRDAAAARMLAPAIGVGEDVVNAN